MKRLNNTASTLAVQLVLRGATDITGFSLLGHGWEICQASGVGLRFDFASLPFTKGAQRYAQEFIFPGGASDNRMYYGKHVHFDSRLDEPSQMLLFDPQTSGGLLLAVPPDKLSGYQKRAAELQQPVWLVGEVLPGNMIEVV
jgi:selenide,water dikinase